MPAADKYTDPKLRDQVKKEIHESDKGGAPGQWSARKAQFMAAEYKKRGGEYNTDKETGQDESQKNLSKWTEEEWQTKEGSGNAKKADGTQKRYLPKKAWDQMTDEEKKATDDKKQSESKEGKQFVGNTDKAKKARSNANDEEAEQFEGKKGQQAKSKGSSKTNGSSKSNGNSKANGSAKTNGTASKGGRQAKAAAQKNMNVENYDPKDIDVEDSDGEDGEGAEEDDDFDPEDAGAGEDEDEEIEEIDDPDDNAAIDGKEAPAGDEEDDEDAAAEGLADDDNDDDVAAEAEEDGAEGVSSKASAGTKRSAKSKNDDSPKKQKTNSGNSKPAGTYGSKHDKNEAPGPVGSADRLPKVGQRVTWKAMPGFVYGKVLEIVTKSKQMQGKSVKASQDDPKVALEADSGKFCVHKPEAMFYE